MESRARRDWIPSEAQRDLTETSPAPRSHWLRELVIVLVFYYSYEIGRRFAHLGKVQAWGIGMLLAVLAFFWAASFGPGDRIAFLIVCIASGIALGADLALPPALLADVIDKQNARDQTGSYFGIWAFATKANLALAAGLALPLVSAFGYRAGEPQSNVLALTLAYTLLPCVLKLCALALLWKIHRKF